MALSSSLIISPALAQFPPDELEATVWGGWREVRGEGSRRGDSAWGRSALIREDAPRWKPWKERLTPIGFSTAKLSHCSCKMLHKCSDRRIFGASFRDRVAVRAHGPEDDSSSPRDAKRMLRLEEEPFVMYSNAMQRLRYWL
ncbi:hypothetical protein EYF80_063580 [Liparis tanakae]|uniref:Uncharacterized protein n=1 Tax=Liparis tanakae TaxID=230148 RepID=A0A4Z2EC31_9TELE|nr:hypothetical protein EYF80_063580 [Liparis tanakae]